MNIKLNKKLMSFLLSGAIALTTMNSMKITSDAAETSQILKTIEQNKNTKNTDTESTNGLKLAVLASETYNTLSSIEQETLLYYLDNLKDLERIFTQSAEELSDLEKKVFEYSEIVKFIKDSTYPFLIKSQNLYDYNVEIANAVAELEKDIYKYTCITEDFYHYDSEKSINELDSYEVIENIINSTVSCDDLNAFLTKISFVKSLYGKDVDSKLNYFEFDSSNEFLSTEQIYDKFEEIEDYEQNILDNEILHNTKNINVSINENIKLYDNDKEVYGVTETGKKVFPILIDNDIYIPESALKSLGFYADSNNYKVSLNGSLLNNYNLVIESADSITSTVQVGKNLTVCSNNATFSSEDIPFDEASKTLREQISQQNDFSSSFGYYEDKTGFFGEYTIENGIEGITANEQSTYHVNFKNEVIEDVRVYYGNIPKFYEDNNIIITSSQDTLRNLKNNTYLNEGNLEPETFTYNGENYVSLNLLTLKNDYSSYDLIENDNTFADKLEFIKSNEFEFKSFMDNNSSKEYALNLNYNTLQDLLASEEKSLDETITEYCINNNLDVFKFKMSLDLYTTNLISDNNLQKDFISYYDNQAEYVFISKDYMKYVDSYIYVKQIDELYNEELVRNVLHEIININKKNKFNIDDQKSLAYSTNIIR